MIRNILWADDDDIAYSQSEGVLLEYLRSIGITCNIYRAKDGNEVVRMLFDGDIRFDLIVLDIVMPNYNGLDTIRSLVRRGLSDRLVVVSAFLKRPEYKEQIDSLVRRKSILGAFDRIDEEVWSVEIGKIMNTDLPRILHISDVHFGKFHAFTRSMDIREIWGPKLREVVRIDAPNLVVISGDLTSVGNSAEFEEAEGFIHWLIGITGLPISRFIIVPGNHDIQQFAELGHRYDRFVDFLDKIAGKDADFLGTYREMYDPIDGRFNRPWEGWQPARLYSLSVIDELRMVIIGMNSIYDGEDDWRRGEIPHSQLLHIMEALDALPVRTRDYIRIAAFHHHLYPVPSNTSGREDRILANQGIVVKELSRAGIRMVLHGHTHYPAIFEIRSHLIYGAEKVASLIVSCTGAIGAAHQTESRPQFSFSLIKIGQDERENARSVSISFYSCPLDSLRWDNLRKIKIVL